MRRLSLSVVVLTVLFAAELAAGVGSGLTQQPSRAGLPSNSQVSGGVVDLNTATVAQLKSLPGMGEAYARRVIAGRPYTAKNQLVTRGVLPQTAYDAIQTRIIAKHAKQ